MKLSVCGSAQLASEGSNCQQYISDLEVMSFTNESPCGQLYFPFCFLLICPNIPPICLIPEDRAKMPEKGCAEPGLHTTDIHHLSVFRDTRVQTP